MVVLEPIPSTDDEPKRSKSTTVAAGSVDSSSGDQANAAGVDMKSDDRVTGDGYASDGFETASETEVGDDETVSDDNNNSNDSIEHQQHHPEELSVASKDQCFEDTLDEDELKQKLLAEMNEAKVKATKIRSICHNNRATCFFKLGKYEESIKECTKALELNPNYMKALLRKAEAHEKLENYEDAIAGMKKILELDPSNKQAKRTIIRLEPLAVEKREKMKEEMLGKLKDMGNTILGKFGMSVDNFKAVKDPNTGSYSISFQR
ncbi:unnamed protein product [Lactuca virosa]|uniref:Tetratricopeptide repeat protein 1 n=1 Tax=Lactuca virosa TaxID=75947 RepID=A0AAU9MK76_9ASTR|nr:unnamed protein product [Lactuca virosa]